MAAPVSAATAAVPGTAASAPAGCSAACCVAGVPEPLRAAVGVPVADRTGAGVPAAAGVLAVEPATAELAAEGRFPLLMNPATPCAASGPGYSCALTEKFGSESPPTVDRTPSEYFVTTSTWPSNRTQSPGRG